jgi:predicted phage tail protein
MKKVVLRGELGKQFGRVHHFDLNTRQKRSGRCARTLKVFSRR